MFWMTLNRKVNIAGLSVLRMDLGTHRHKSNTFYTAELVGCPSLRQLVSQNLFFPLFHKRKPS